MVAAVDAGTVDPRRCSVILIRAVSAAGLDGVDLDPKLVDGPYQVCDGHGAWRATT